MQTAEEKPAPAQDLISEEDEEEGVIVAGGKRRCLATPPDVVDGQSEDDDTGVEDETPNEEEENDPVSPLQFVRPKRETSAARERKEKLSDPSLASRDGTDLLERLFCFTAFHARESQSTISVWENKSDCGSPFGTLTVRGTEGNIQTSTFKCSVNLMVEVDLGRSEIDPHTLWRNGRDAPKREEGDGDSSRRIKTPSKHRSSLSDEDVSPADARMADSRMIAHKRRRLIPGERRRLADSMNSAGSVLQYLAEEPGSSTPGGSMGQRDRRGRKSLKGGSARDTFTESEMERLKGVVWPAETRNRDGLPAVWCPRCFLESAEFLHLQVSTRLTIKGEPRIDLRHAKCAKGFSPDLFPRSIIDSYLKHALARQQ
eukprot:Gregarina_sp_Poly_1__7080@NODE_386_length_9004_cov_34_917534_g315_i0_p3_GENE_NODE_386_length_9004_cov_34_917534_g315_i0NODE_386_length_9004_cov_34_917534_g315_i0_p3_ORF_typecomplete_len372_score79_17_NODE_386_length_9004_cov_34_917534_g315_i047985913